MADDEDDNEQKPSESNIDDDDIDNGIKDDGNDMEHENEQKEDTSPIADSEVPIIDGLSELIDAAKQQKEENGVEAGDEGRNTEQTDETPLTANLPPKGLDLFAGGLTDIANSPAYTFLDEVTANGTISEGKANDLRSKYLELHEIVLKVYEKERTLLSQAKSLNQELLSQRVLLDKSGSLAYEDNTEMGELRRDVLKSENALAIAEERQKALDIEQETQITQKQALEQEIADIKRRQQDMMEPQVQATSKEIKELKIEVHQRKSQTKQLSEDIKEFTSNLKALTDRVNMVGRELQRQKDILAETIAEPIRLQKEGEQLSTASRHVDAEIRRLVGVGIRLDADNEQIAKRTKNLDETTADHRSIVAKQLTANELKSKTSEAHERDLILAQNRLASTVENKANIIERINRADRIWVEMHDALGRRMKDRDNTVKALRRSENLLRSAQSELPNLQTALKESEIGLHEIKGSKKHDKQQLKSLRGEVKLYMRQFLTTEECENRTKDELTNLLHTNDVLEKELVILYAKERRLHEDIGDVSMEKEKKARDLTRARIRFRRTVEDLKIHELAILDNTKKHSEILVQLREFAQMYDVVKNERNKYVNMIQASSQRAAEMKEKVKILHNEIEILRQEAHAKDKCLVRSKFELQNLYAVRDTLQNDTNRMLQSYMTRRSAVDQQLGEMEKLNSIINGIEEDMASVKQHYNVAVSARNYAGVQTIERNDELCVMYEKLNIQDTLLKNGEMEMMGRDDDIRVLELTKSEMVREIKVLKKQQPAVKEKENEIIQVKKELLDTQQQSKDLEKVLENPSEDNVRWRKLGGQDPSPEVLFKTTEQLEVRLSEKEERKLELDLVCDEIDTLYNKMKAHADSNKEDTIALACSINDFQAKIKDVTRKMMSLVSELSMHQAEALKLQQQKHEKEAALQQGLAALERGEAPDNASEQEWYRMERIRKRKQEEAVESATAQMQTTQTADGVHTTAESRPNAYLPDEATDLPIPRPYGNHAPFKPTDQGAQMRHFKKPKNIVIEL